MAPWRTLGQVLSMVEMTKTEVPTELMELADRLDWAQSRVGAAGGLELDSPGLLDGLDGSAAGVKRPG